MIPDLVGSSFRNLEVHDVDVGLRFYGGNVAEMWLSESMLDHWRVAGVQLLGYAIRTARPRNSSRAAAVAPPLQDADGREIFVDSIPAYALAHDGAVLPCPPYCADGSPRGSREVGGGQPSVVIDRIVASGNVGWLVDSDTAAVRLQGVRLEGQSGIMRNTGVPGAWPAACADETSTDCGPIADSRFADILIDVSNSYGTTSRPANDTAIQFDRPGQLHLIGGTIGSRVMTGNSSAVFDVGARFQHGGHIAAAEGTSGAKVYGLQEHNETAALRGEVSELRREVEALRQLILAK
jgi:hypothetical protein